MYVCEYMHVHVCIRACVAREMHELAALSREMECVCHSIILVKYVCMFVRASMYVYTMHAHVCIHVHVCIVTIYIL